MGTDLDRVDDPLRRAVAVPAYAVAGLAAGGGFALLGLALTFTYLATRTVNFALGAIGTIGTFSFATLHASGVPLPLAAIGGILAGTAAGLLLGAVVVGWFGDATVEARSVLTIAMLVTLLAVGGLIWDGRAQPVPAGPSSVLLRIDGVPVSAATAVVLTLAVGAAAGISLLMTRTLLGRRLTAVSERAHTAELLGIPVRTYGLWVWGLSSAFAVVAIWLLATTSATEFGVLSLSVLPALAAALFGLFRSLALTVAGGVVLGVLQSLAAGTEALSRYATAVPFVALLAILVYSQRGERWEDAR